MGDEAAGPPAVGVGVANGVAAVGGAGGELAGDEAGV